MRLGCCFAPRRTSIDEPQCYVLDAAKRLPVTPPEANVYNASRVCQNDDVILPEYSFESLTNAVISETSRSILVDECTDLDLSEGNSRISYTPPTNP